MTEVTEQLNVHRGTVSTWRNWSTSLESEAILSLSDATRTVTYTAQISQV